MTPIPRTDYRIGVPSVGSYNEIFNSDATEFYGSGVSNAQPIASEESMWHGRPQSIRLNVPPLGAVVLKKSH
jgi:1,4-alpha-glucan branching enzyme